MRVRRSIDVAERGGALLFQGPDDFSLDDTAARDDRRGTGLGYRFGFRPVETREASRRRGIEGEAAGEGLRQRLDVSGEVASGKRIVSARFAQRLAEDGGHARHGGDGHVAVAGELATGDA